MPLPRERGKKDNYGIRNEKKKNCFTDIVQVEIK